MQMFVVLDVLLLLYLVPSAVPSPWLLRSLLLVSIVTFHWINCYNRCFQVVPEKTPRAMVLSEKCKRRRTMQPDDRSQREDGTADFPAQNEPVQAGS